MSANAPSRQLQRHLQALTGLRQRRARSLDEALALTRAALAQAQGQHVQAQADLKTCEHALQAALAARGDLLQQAFTPAHVKAADLAIEACQQASTEAGKAVHRTLTVVQQQQQRVQQAQTAVQRNQQRLDQFAERLRQVRSALQTQDDETADEEAEEQAIARLASRKSAGSSSPQDTR